MGHHIINSPGAGHNVQQLLERPIIISFLMLRLSLFQRNTPKNEMLIFQMPKTYPIYVIIDGFQKIVS